MKGVMIVGALRTPIGCFRDALVGHSAVEPDSLVVKVLIECTGVLAYVVDEVIFGQALTVGAGQDPVRQSAIKGSLPSNVSATIINGVCGSGLKVLHSTIQAIQCGEVDTVVAGGQENMSRAPHVLAGSHTGMQLGNSQLVDSLVHDRLWGALNDYHIGVIAENLTREYDISRQLQGAYTPNSRQRTRAVIDVGRSKNGIVPVITRSNGQILVVNTSEQPRTDTSAGGLARLDLSFDSLGFVTAGSVSSISDGAAAVMMMSEAKVRALNLPVLARICAFASTGMDPALMGIVPVYAIHRCPERTGWQLAGVDLIEASEAFATQTFSVGKMSEWNERRVNVNGGVIILGYPIGAPSCRILVSLVHEMVRRNTHKGLVTLCIGRGQSVASTIERDEQLYISSLPINICRH